MTASRISESSRGSHAFSFSPGIWSVSCTFLQGDTKSLLHSLTVTLTSQLRLCSSLSNTGSFFSSFRNTICITSSASCLFRQSWRASLYTMSLYACTVSIYVSSSKGHTSQAFCISEKLFIYNTFWRVEKSHDALFYFYKFGQQSHRLHMSTNSNHIHKIPSQCLDLPYDLCKYLPYTHCQFPHSSENIFIFVYN